MGYEYGKEQGQLIGYENGTETGYKLGDEAGFRRGETEAYNAGVKVGRDRSISDPSDPNDEFQKGYEKGK